DVLLDFIPMVGAHTGENLVKVFMDLMHDLNIATKILAITTDNATNNDTMMMVLEEQ
ncbi:hypothetical protein EC973_000579, partial [Apophysomyces ossiformis]